MIFKLSKLGSFNLFLSRGVVVTKDSKSRNKSNTMKLNTLVSIAILSASAEAKKPAFAPKSYTHDVLSVRGGAGSLDPDMIGKAAINLVQ